MSLLDVIFRADKCGSIDILCISHWISSMIRISHCKHQHFIIIHWICITIDWMSSIFNNNMQQFLMLLILVYLLYSFMSLWLRTRSRSDCNMIFKRNGSKCESYYREYSCQKTIIYMVWYSIKVDDMIMISMHFQHLLAGDSMVLSNKR